MPSSRKSSTASKVAGIAVAAPQVIAHRVARMALAGPTPDARDRREFATMVLEKQWAFAQRCMAWHTAVLSWQMQWLKACMSGDYAGALSRMFTPLPLAAAGEKAMSQALEPVRRKAVANAKRLAMTPLKR